MHVALVCVQDHCQTGSIWRKCPGFGVQLGSVALQTVGLGCSASVKNSTVSHGKSLASAVAGASADAHGSDWGQRHHFQLLFPVPSEIKSSVLGFSVLLRPEQLNWC